MDDIRRFIVVGKHSSPEDFENYVLAQWIKKEALELYVVEEAASGSSEPKKVEGFRVCEIFGHPHFWVNVEAESGNWIRIDAANEKVFFDLFPGVSLP